MGDDRPSLFERTVNRIRADVRLRLDPGTLAQAREGAPLMLSASEAEQLADATVAVLDGLGLRVVEVCACGQPIGTCHDCGEPRCWHCDPGLGKQHQPMKCSERHAPPEADELLKAWHAGRRMAEESDRG